MKLKNLVHYVENTSDKTILNELTKSDDKDIIQYIINVTSDLLNGVFLGEEYSNNVKNNLSNYNDIELGELSIYISITPYVQSALQQGPNWAEKASSFLECFLGYIIGMISKEDFLANLVEMKNLLNMSDKFYTGLVYYFAENQNYITNNILDKLQ